MTTMYISPKLMAELRDRAVRVEAGDDGALIWLRDQRVWLWVSIWQAKAIGRDFRASITIPPFDLAAEDSKQRQVIADYLASQPEPVTRTCLACSTVWTPMADVFPEMHCGEPTTEFGYAAGLPYRQRLEPPAERSERLERERLVVLGRLFEDLRRGDGVDLYVLPATETEVDAGGQAEVAWIKWQSLRGRRDLMRRLSPEELEAVRGIR